MYDAVDWLNHVDGRKSIGQALVAHTCNPNTWEAESNISELKARQGYSKPLSQINQIKSNPNNNNNKNLEGRKEKERPESL
jgi:hypothetical protein